MEIINERKIEEKYSLVCKLVEQLIDKDFNDKQFMKFKNAAVYTDISVYRTKGFLGGSSVMIFKINIHNPNEKDIINIEARYFDKYPGNDADRLISILKSLEKRFKNVKTKIVII